MELCGGMQICVLEGTNTGACRRVVSGLSETTVCNKTQAAHSLCPERHFTFDKPFPSPLDETSLVSIMPFVGHMAFNGNDYSDGARAMQKQCHTYSTQKRSCATNYDCRLVMLYCNQLQVARSSFTPPHSGSWPPRTNSRARVGCRPGLARMRGGYGTRTCKSLSWTTRSWRGTTSGITIFGGSHRSHESRPSRRTLARSRSIILVAARRWSRGLLARSRTSKASPSTGPLMAVAQRTLASLGR